MDFDLQGALATRDLLALYADLLDELKSRDEIRSTNNPVADYAEFLVAKALALKLAGKSTAGYDAVDAARQKYEIKARRLTGHNKSRQLSAFRGLDEKKFDYLAGVIFNSDFTVRRACLIPHSSVKELATYKGHVNAWVLHLRESVWEVEGVEDLTKKLEHAQSM